MIRYRILNKFTGVCCYAFLLTDNFLERNYIKEKYGFEVSCYDIGKFLIVDEVTNDRTLVKPNEFKYRYVIIDRTPIYPVIPFVKPSDGFKIDIEKRREWVSKGVSNWLRWNVMNTVYGSPERCKSSFADTCERIRKFNEIWPPFKHIDIRELEKEKHAMSNNTRTINFCVKNVIFNGPATVVIWGDGTKTVVKCKEGDSYSRWAGFAMCFAKKLYGKDFHRQFRCWCGTEDDIPEKTYSDCTSVSEAVKFASDAFTKFGKNVSECINDITEALNAKAKVNDYRDVVFKDTFEAGLVLKNMRNIIDTLGFVSVADCCHLVDALIHFGDHDIGWTDISKAMVIPVANGFIIKYPEPSSRTQPNEVKGLD